VFEAMVQDLRALLRMMQGKRAEPSAVILDGRTLQSTPESVKNDEECPQNTDLRCPFSNDEKGGWQGVTPCPSSTLTKEISHVMGAPSLSVRSSGVRPNRPALRFSRRR